MDSSISTINSYSPSSLQYQYQQDSLVLQATLVESNDDSSVIDINRLSQGLTITADEIIKKLNELLADKVPNGIESLNPDDFTSEKTATAIVDGITALYSKYVESNPELSPEEALDRFMKAARSGVDAGYDDAVKTLDGIGAFQFDGVQSGIEETKKLIGEKLNAFEAARKKEFAGEETVSATAAASTSSSLLTQASVTISA